MPAFIGIDYHKTYSVYSVPSRKFPALCPAVNPSVRRRFAYVIFAYMNIVIDEYVGNAIFRPWN